MEGGGLLALTECVPCVTRALPRALTWTRVPGTVTNGPEQGKSNARCTNATEPSRSGARDGGRAKAGRDTRAERGGGVGLPSALRAGARPGAARWCWCSPEEKVREGGDLDGGDGRGVC